MHSGERGVFRSVQIGMIFGNSQSGFFGCTETGWMRSFSGETPLSHARLPHSEPIIPIQDGVSTYPIERIGFDRLPRSGHGGISTEVKVTERADSRALGQQNVFFVESSLRRRQQFYRPARLRTLGLPIRSAWRGYFRYRRASGLTRGISDIFGTG
jgi:hypothetical protein